LVNVASALRPLMASISAELLSQTELNFAREGRPKWPALASSTQRQRARRGHGAAHPILRSRRPHLVRSLVSSFGDQHASLGSDVVYAAIHQLGGKAGRNHAIPIPARPYLPLEADGKAFTQAMEKKINALLLKHLLK